MKILLACEESGSVRDEFTKLGHYAMSCDLQPSRTEGNHYHGDVMDIINDEWDLLIAFPPCTHLAVSGAAHFDKKRKDGRQKEGIDFFMKFAELTDLFSTINIPMVAIENPIGIMSSLWRRPDQIIQPWQFGDSFQKSTCLWLKNLPLLRPTNIVDPGEFITLPGGGKMPKWYSDNKSSKNRSKTFPGIAKAMANQWSSL